jgi:hypothetical protein
VLGQQGDESLKDSLQLATGASLVFDIAQARSDKGRKRRRSDFSDKVGVFPCKHEDADQSDDGKGTSGRRIRLLEVSKESLDPRTRLAEDLQTASLDSCFDQDNGRPPAFNGAILEESRELCLEAMHSDTIVRVLLARRGGGREKVSALPQRGRHLGSDSRQLVHRSGRDAEGELLEDSRALRVGLLSHLFRSAPSV